jgi:(E)-4-hydroxy-3-methylbut-2-enyl-diphosphate synthase
MLGGGAPPLVQTMWKDPLGEDQDVVRRRLERLAEMNCAMVRFAVPDEAAAERLIRLAAVSPLPLVADIHFDYRLALRCIRGGVQKVRINPGNIGSRRRVEEVVKAAKEHGVPVRVGVNSGSLPKDLRGSGDTAEAMVTAAEREMEVFTGLDFEELVFSLKSSDIDTTVRANELFAERHPYPLHIGVTEAGPLIPGVVKSSIALYRLLSRGVGDTIRVSLSDTPENEVITGLEILGAAGLGVERVEIISCPRCGRATFDTHRFTEQVAPYLYGTRKKAKVAIMGCVVNGPGEASSADLGITGAGREIIIFKKGKVFRRVQPEEALEVFIKELEKL